MHQTQVKGGIWKGNEEKRQSCSSRQLTVRQRSVPSIFESATPVLLFTFAHSSLAFFPTT